MKNVVEIKKLGINGEGIGYVNKTVTFIPNCLPGEEVEYTDLVKHEGYNSAKVLNIIKKSPDRVYPKCRIFDRCQVCSLMPLKYEKQLEAKQLYFEETINKYAKFQPKVSDFVKSPDTYNYRNTIKLPLFNLREKLAIGIHFRDSNHYVYLNDCVVQNDAINNTLKDVLAILDEYRYKAYDKKTKLGLRYLLVRAFNDEVMITFVIGKNTRIIDEAIERIMELNGVVSLNQTTNTKGSNEIIVETIKNIKGKKSINVPFNDYTYKLSPASFFQLNTRQAINVYDQINTYLGTNNNLVLDLFCGVGSITTYIAKNAKNVIGIDNNRSSINDAKENIKKHRINNVKFYCDDVDHVIKLVAKQDNIDAIIVDPPRTGLTDFTKESIIKSKSKKLIYVSCNPATLAKDLTVLKQYYDVQDIKLYDMFPHTMHVESITYLTRKSTKKSDRY